MLESLYIKDFILIDELNMSFEKGFSSFTGETGAGKSILMDAIGLLCGDRFNANQIREGCDKAIIEGTFSLNKKLKEKFLELGFEDDEIIITREINREGKSSCRINHRSASLANLKETIGEYVDIHSQRENQYLLNQKYHLDLLDTYANNDELCLTIKNQYHQYQKLFNEIDDLKNGSFSKDQEEIYRYQLNEIESIDPVIGEDEEIEWKLRMMSSYEKIYSSLQDSIQNLDGEKWINLNLYQVAKQLQTLKDSPELNDIGNVLESHYYECLDLTERLKNYQANMDLDEAEIEQLNQRINQINQLKRKYGITIESILQKKDELINQLELIENKDFIISKKEKELSSLLTDYQKTATELSNRRKKAAKELSVAVMKELKDLQLKNAVFDVEILEGKMTNKGIDEISFMVSTNPGESLKPLQKVASGGELSRFMLGLKAIFSKLWGCELVIFDEIDTGVSGAVALSVGKKMKMISNYCQVFAVTHLAPVAACGDNQYKVNKEVRDNHTYTSLELLDDKKRIEELAYINTGTNSDAAKKAAKELLENAKQ